MDNGQNIYSGIIELFEGKKILVIGDAILDIFLKGESNRLCPEAPVPLVDITQRTARPGGAANVAMNLKMLGAEVSFCSVTGRDEYGDEMYRLLKEKGLHLSKFIRTSARSTIAKTRILSGSQVITRFDEGCTGPLDEATALQLCQLLETDYCRYDAIILSDYDKGVITKKVLDKTRYLQRRHHKFLAVDSRRLSYFSCLEPALIKPNYKEALALLGNQAGVATRADYIKQQARLLFSKTRATLMAVTMDAEGSLIINRGEVMHRSFAPAVAMPHVSGAGDTYLAAFLLGYLCSRDIFVSASMATAAATIVIRQEETSCCRRTDLLNYFNACSKYIPSGEELRLLCDSYRQTGKRIVFTNGCFDILHSGHVSFLRAVKRLGDVVIVGVNTDESVRRLKGSTRPVNHLQERLQVLAGLEFVDHVMSFGSEDDDTPVPAIHLVRPDVFAKGGDYDMEQLPEAPVVKSLGGEVVFIPYIPEHSTTSVIRKINSTHTTGKSTVPL